MEINAVFEGGGIKGIALAGAVRAAEQAGRRFVKVAGTSSGSIVASLLAAGYTGTEMADIIRHTSFSSFLQRAPIYNTRYVGPALRVLIKKGLYSGDALEQWIREWLSKKGIVRFGDLPRGSLRIIASDITNGRLLVLPDDLKLYGLEPDRFQVAKAVRMSCSIPYFFDPAVIRLNGEAARGRRFADQFVYIVDGGLLSNFPLWLFEQEEKPAAAGKRVIPTVGFQLIGRTKPEPHRITGPFSMLSALVGTMLSAHDERYIEQEKFKRTVKIPSLGVGTTQFELPPELGEALYAAGYEAGERFFANWRG